MASAPTPKRTILYLAFGVVALVVAVVVASRVNLTEIGPVKFSPRQRARARFIAFAAVLLVFAGIGQSVMWLSRRVQRNARGRDK